VKDRRFVDLVIGRIELAELDSTSSFSGTGGGFSMATCAGFWKGKGIEFCAVGLGVCGQSEYPEIEVGDVRSLRSVVAADFSSMVKAMGHYKERRQKAVSSLRMRNEVETSSKNKT
jgi:hypothetical protein